MIDRSVLVWVAAAVLGLSLGGVFYGGLWWTVRRALPSRHPAVWFACSLALRIAVALGGFYLITTLPIGAAALGGAPWPRLAMCSLGFLAGRLLTVHLLAVRRSGPGVAPSVTPTDAAGA